MTKKEIKQFINHMAKNYNDFWEPEDVERVYGDYNLEDAISDRAHDFEQLSNIMKIAFGEDPLNGKHW